jgi:hypothetical protein
MTWQLTHRRHGALLTVQDAMRGCHGAYLLIA